MAELPPFLTQPSNPVPPEWEDVRRIAALALEPVKECVSNVNPYLNWGRTNAGRGLPPHYLVYFLLVDLLRFRNLGREEKVAWTVPITFEGEVFLIEHRKMGLGVFSPEPEAKELAARSIVIRIQKAVKAAQPFFNAIADRAVAQSKLNVFNRHRELWGRYEYLRGLHEQKSEEAIRRKDESVRTEQSYSDGGKGWSITRPSSRLRKEAKWAAMSAIEAFFSWSEHIFIHIGILTGAIHSGQEVSDLAAADWGKKFRAAMGSFGPSEKKIYDELGSIRNELRNYIAHGAFGKEGEAFQFHSSAGAVPVLLPHRAKSKKFVLGSGIEFDSTEAIRVIERAIKVIWAGPRLLTRIYIEEFDLPAILPMAANGTYVTAMRSEPDMRNLTDHISRNMGRSANMDW